MPDGYRRIIRDHVYEKCWLLDITWAEVEQLLTDCAVVEETTDEHGRPKQVRLAASAPCRRGGRPRQQDADLPNTL